MAKRGETQPYKVRYQWNNGIKGTVARSTRDEADMKADQIRRAASYREDATVTVTVSYEPKVARRA